MAQALVLVLVLSDLAAAQVCSPTTEEMPIELTTSEPRESLEGTYVGLDSDTLHVEVDTETQRVPLSSLAEARVRCPLAEPRGPKVLEGAAGGFLVGGAAAASATFAILGPAWGFSELGLDLMLAAGAAGGVIGAVIGGIIGTQWYDREAWVPLDEAFGSDSACCALRIAPAPTPRREAPRWSAEVSLRLP